MVSLVAHSRRWVCHGYEDAYLRLLRVDSASKLSHKVRADAGTTFDRHQH
jgi:hypothetical protein